MAGYAIIEISEAYLNAFAADPRIIYIDKPKSVEQQVSYAQYASCLSGTFINNYGLDGDGTIFAIIDSGIDYRHNEFVRDGKSRILSFWDQQAVYQDTYANTYKLGRTMLNVNGSTTTAVIVGKSLKKLDKEVFNGASVSENN